MSGDAPIATPTRPPSGGRVISPINVFVANLLAGACLGYFLLGQKQKGIVALILFVLLMGPTWCTGSLLLSLVAAVDGYLQASEVAAGHTVSEWTFFRGRA